MAVKKEKISFSFGKNWTDFVKKYYTAERLEEALKSLKDLSGLEDFKGKTFLDIGSGSGLFSLSAYKMGAEKVISFDVDPYSVSCTGYLREKEGSPEKWDVLEGSILDKDWLHKHIAKSDIVYSWGVLHHTGDMWNAIKNAASFVKPGGKFIIAIYNEYEGANHLSSRSWVKVKKFYNAVPKLVKKLMELGYTTAFLMASPRWTNVKNKIAYIKNYKSSRGMNFWTDVKDWLGGYPYEYASREAITDFCSKMGFEIEKTIPCDGTGCNQFLFNKKS